MIRKDGASGGVFAVVRDLAWGEFDENTYVVGDESGCVVFDPGAPADLILPLVAGRKVAAILLTHTHLDHILGADELRDATGAPVVAPAGEATGLEDPRVNLSAAYGVDIRRRPAEKVARAGDRYRAGGIELQACNTPGHSPGHLAWKSLAPAEKFVISGDALFSGSIGRTDFPGASHDLLIASIRRELLTLPDETIVYPGHGPRTTVGTERKYNPFLR